LKFLLGFLSLLIRDFNILLEKLQELISNLVDWHLVKINGPCISWNSGSCSSVIDHAIVNSKIKELIYVKWNRIKCLEYNMEIFGNYKFNVIHDEFQNESISSNDLYDKFVSTVYSIANDCGLTSAESIQKTMFHMFQKIFDTQKLNMKSCKDIKRLGSTNNLDNFIN